MKNNIFHCRKISSLPIKFIRNHLGLFGTPLEVPHASTVCVNLSSSSHCFLRKFEIHHSFNLNFELKPERRMSLLTFFDEPQKIAEHTNFIISQFNGVLENLHRQDDCVIALGDAEANVQDWQWTCELMAKVNPKEVARQVYVRLMS
jgi:hypothetical protein